MDATSKRTTIFILIMFIAIMSQLSFDNYLPSLPYLTTLFHAKAATLRLTVIIFIFGAGLSSFFFGILSDRVGRKISLLYALFSFTIGNLICLLAFGPVFLIIGRLLQGIGVGGCLTLNRVVLCDVTENQSELARFGSYLSTAISVIPAISPTIGAYIFVHLGWRANFILLFIAALFSVILTWRILPETQAESFEKTDSLVADIKQIIITPVFIGFLICAGLITTAAIALMSIGPHLFQIALHLNPIQYGYITFFVGIAMILGSYSNAWLIKYIGLRKTVDTGVVVIIFSSLAMLLGYLLGYINIFVILIPAMFYLFGGDFVSTNAFAGAISTLKSKAGIATALYTSLQLLFSSVI